MSRYVAFDVETPNYANDRMSAIGVVVLEDGEIIRRFGTLINPETHFDWFNVQLTGITQEAAAKSPTFPEIWTLIEPWFSSGVLAAHNAPFDLGVLGKCLRHYQIDWKPTAEYVCTCRIGKALCPGLPNHRLDTMAAHFRIPLDHHRALSDTEACAGLLQRYLKQDPELRLFRRTYDFSTLRTVRIF
ncbi:MAG: 3'-5' exonuclease [Oscillospiraceae bacterium]|nr:3'-5' exonuclease [Oscillospiraceae bacterium]